MKGLTAKVFRTYNASKTMQDQIDIIENEGTVAEKWLNSMLPIERWLFYVITSVRSVKPMVIVFRELMTN